MVDLVCAVAFELSFLPYVAGRAIPPISMASLVFFAVEALAVCVLPLVVAAAVVRFWPRRLSFGLAAFLPVTSIGPQTEAAGSAGVGVGLLAGSTLCLLVAGMGMSLMGLLAADR
jgi:hypothetical protein